MNTWGPALDAELTYRREQVAGRRRPDLGLLRRRVPVARPAADAGREATPRAAERPARAA
jgi:hypothetical protein